MVLRSTSRLYRKKHVKSEVSVLRAAVPKDVTFHQFVENHHIAISHQKLSCFDEVEANYNSVGVTV